MNAGMNLNLWHKIVLYFLIILDVILLIVCMRTPTTGLILCSSLIFVIIFIFFKKHAEEEGLRSVLKISFIGLIIIFVIGTLAYFVLDREKLVPERTLANNEYYNGVFYFVKPDNLLIYNFTFGDNNQIVYNLNYDANNSMRVIGWFNLSSSFVLDKSKYFDLYFDSIITKRNYNMTIDTLQEKYSNKTANGFVYYDKSVIINKNFFNGVICVYDDKSNRMGIIYYLGYLNNSNLMNNYKKELIDTIKFS